MAPPPPIARTGRKQIEMNKTRFQDTLQALRDCREHLGDPLANLSTAELEARKELIKLCYEFSLDVIETELEDREE